MAVYTYYELKRQVLRRLDEVGQQTTEDNVADYMNAAHERLCNMAPWNWMIGRETDVNTTPGSRDLVLKHNLRMLMWLTHADGTPVPDVSQRQLAQRGVKGFIRTGSPTGYTVFGLSPVAKQPPKTGTTYTLVSSDGADTGINFAIAIKGEDVNGNERAEVIVPAGTTPVAGTVNWRAVEGVTKSQEYNGTLTLTAADTSVALTLLPWEMARQYTVLRLDREPTEVETLTYQGIREPLKLVNAYDIPHIPAADGQVLVYETLLEAATYNRDITAQDISIWSGFRDQHITNLYGRELGNPLFGQGDSIHVYDDGWDDAF